MFCAACTTHKSQWEIAENVDISSFSSFRLKRLIFYKCFSEVGSTESKGPTLLKSLQKINPCKLNESKKCQNFLSSPIDFNCAACSTKHQLILPLYRCYHYQEGESIDVFCCKHVLCCNFLLMFVIFLCLKNDLCQ